MFVESKLLYNIEELSVCYLCSTGVCQQMCATSSGTNKKQNKTKTKNKTKQKKKDLKDLIVKSKILLPSACYMRSSRACHQMCAPSGTKTKRKKKNLKNCLLKAKYCITKGKCMLHAQHHSFAANMCPKWDYSHMLMTKPLQFNSYSFGTDHSINVIELESLKAEQM